ncbi:sugar transferase [bacterium]|jgi:lipopolysaccharide/colanic/teichoic acid biosynthesis glycosyltransferase|nr:sugar transferase [bacterium]
MYRRFFKRSLDVIASGLGLVVLVPVFVGIALAVKLGSKGPVLFRHERVGKDFSKIYVLKFRSMVTDAVTIGPGITSAGDTRITGVGRILRRTKLDELPQLWNVLKGDMSIVGPRPEIQKYVDLFKPDYQIILQIRPGITDNAAIAFRNEEVVLAQYEDKEKAYVDHILPQKINLYKTYINQIGFWGDIKLIFKTVLG